MPTEAIVQTVNSMHRASSFDQDIIQTIYQYESDLLYPPTGDSLARRLERVRKVIAQLEEAK